MSSTNNAPHAPTNTPCCPHKLNGSIDGSVDEKPWSTQIEGPAASAWRHGLCSCCATPLLSLLTYFAPCFTYGQTYHRVNKDGGMRGYGPFNTSCLLFCTAWALGVPCLPHVLLLQDLREKHNIKGSCFGDYCSSYWCLCCSMVRAERESKEREKAGGKATVDEQYARESMRMERPGKEGEGGSESARKLQGPDETTHVETTQTGQPEQHGPAQPAPTRQSEQHVPPAPTQMPQPDPESSQAALPEQQAPADAAETTHQPAADPHVPVQTTGTQMPQPDQPVPVRQEHHGPVEAAETARSEQLVAGA